MIPTYQPMFTTTLGNDIGADRGVSRPNVFQQLQIKCVHISNQLNIHS